MKYFRSIQKQQEIELLQFDITGYQVTKLNSKATEQKLQKFFVTIRNAKFNYLQQKRFFYG